MTSNLMCLRFFTLRSSSLWIIDIMILAKMNKLDPLSFPRSNAWRGTGGREPGRTGGGRGTGDGRRKGGRRDLYDGGKRERNSKRQAFAICYCLLPVKETNPRTFLDFHLTFSEAYSKILYTRKFKKRKFVLEVKKAVLLPVKLETFPSRFIHHRT